MRGTEGAQEPPSQEPNTLLPSRSSARLRGSSTSLNLRRSTRRTSAGSVLTSATTEATAAATTTRKRKKTSSSRMSSSERLVSEPTATEEGSGAAKETRATTVAPPAASSDKSTSNPLNNKATKKKKTKASSVKKPRVVEERELLGEMEHYKDNVDSDDDEHAFYTADMDPEADSKQYGEDEEENEEEEEEDEEDMMGQGNGGFMANFSRILQGRTAPTSQARPSGRFGRILTVLESTGRVDEKLATLGELSEFLSMATEDMFHGYAGVAMGFQPEAFVRALLRQFNMESAGSLGFEDDMGGIPPELAAEMGFPLGGTGGSQAYPELVILSCRCLSNLIEALPSSTMHIVHADGVQVLVEKLLSIEYIDLAESILSILDKLSGEFPSAVLKGNGLMAALQYIDFFGIHVQRTAISIAANACRGLGSYQNNRTTGEKLNYFLNFFGSSWDLDEKGNGPNALSAVDLVKEIMPILDRLITYSDARLLENAMRCLSRIVEWAHELVLADFESIVTASLLKTLTQIAGPLSTNHPVIFTMLTKILSQIARASDAYAGLLVSEDNILPLIVRCLSGKGDTLVMTSVVSQPPEQIVAILNVASEILPRLPDSENWNLTVPENPALYMTDASTSPRLELLRGTPKVFDQYLIELLPIFISVFGITVNMAIRRKCLECIVKTVWFSPIDALMNAELVSLGKFITDLLGLSQHFIGKSAQDKETAETKSFVAVGLQVAMILLKRDGPKFRTYFRREGVLAEMTKVLDHLVASAASGNAATSSVPVSASRNRSSSSRDMDQVLRNIAEDLSKFEESIGGEANTAGSTALPGVTSETRVSAMVNDMRSAFETLRQEETRASASSGPRKTIKALNEKMFTDVQVQEWMTWLCKDILHSAVSHQDEGQSLVKDLEEIRDVLRMSTRTDLKNMLAVMHCFASLLAGDQKTSGLTGFEIVESGVVEALLVYLTDSAATVQSLENRVLLFYHVFMNSALEDQEAGRFVSGAFESLVTRLQETLSRTESLLVAKAVPQNGSGSSGSVFALLNTLVGMGGSRDPIDNPTLQLARQIRVKLVAADPEDVPKQYQAMTVSVHAVATFRSLEEFLRGRIFISSPAERVLESHDDEDKDEVMEDWEDDEEIGPFDEDGDVNLGDIILESERVSRTSRPRGDSISSQGDKTEQNANASSSLPTNGKEAVVEFPPEEGAPRVRKKKPEASKRVLRSASTPKTKESKSYAQAAKPAKYEISFSLEDKEVPSESTIFGAFYQFEREKAESPNCSPNVWNQSYTVKFKKVAEKMGDAKSLKSMSSSSSLAETHAIPFNTFPSVSLLLDSDTKNVLRLLGVLYELNSKWPRIFSWLRTGTEDLESNLGLAPLSPTAFLNSKITAKLNLQMDEPLIVASRVLPSWCHTICHDYGFLVPFDTRLTYLQSQSFGYSRNMARWQQQQNSSNTNAPTDSPLLGRIQRQKVRLSRARVLDSMVKVLEAFGATQALLEVEFFDEVGTGLGPTLEFYSLVCQEYRKSAGVESVSLESPLQLWRTHGNAHSEFLNNLFPMPMTTEGQESEIGKKRITFFKALGMLVAKAMLDSRVLDMPFSPVLVDMAVFGHSSVDKQTAIRTVDPSLNRSLHLLHQFGSEVKSISQDISLSEADKSTKTKALTIQGAKIEEMCLDFTLPGYPEIELIPKGAETMVSAENVQEYVERVTDLTVGSGVRAQVQAFRKGFSKVFPIYDLHSFSVPELIVLLGGDAKEDWGEEVIKEALCADHGYTKDSRVISDLVRMMSEFTDEERRHFLQFSTGCPRLPHGGFKGLSPPLTVVRKSTDSKNKPDDYLPSVMTCVNYLKLPEYSNLEAMTTRFKFAMKEGQGSFHLS